MGDEVRNYIANEKKRIIDENTAQNEEMKKKKKKGWVELETNPDKIKPRLPDEIIYKIFKWRFTLNDINNRGYILDGFPKSLEQAKFMFGGKNILKIPYL